MRAWHKQPEPPPLGRLRREDVLPPRPHSGSLHEVHDPAAEVARRAAALRFVVLDKEMERDRRARELRSKAELLRHYPWRPLGTSGRAHSAPLHRTTPGSVPELVAPAAVPVPGLTIFSTRRRKAWSEDKQKPAALRDQLLGTNMIKPSRAVAPVSPLTQPQVPKPYQLPPDAAAIPALQAAVHRSLGAARCESFLGPGGDSEFSADWSTQGQSLGVSSVQGEAGVIEDKTPLPGKGVGVVSARESIRALLQEARLELRILQRKDACATRMRLAMVHTTVVVYMLSGV